MEATGRGVGALDPEASAELRDALLAAASEVHFFGRMRSTSNLAWRVPPGGLT